LGAAPRLVVCGRASRAGGTFRLGRRSIVPIVPAVPDWGFHHSGDRSRDRLIVPIVPAGTRKTSTGTIGAMGTLGCVTLRKPDLPAAAAEVTLVPELDGNPDFPKTRGHPSKDTG